MNEISEATFLKAIKATHGADAGIAELQAQDQRLAEAVANTEP